MPLAATLALVLFAVPAPQADLPDRAAIESRIAALQGTDDPDAKKDLELQRSALEALDRRAAYEEDAQQFTRDVDEAPARVESLQSQLAAPVTPVDRAALEELDLDGLERSYEAAEADLEAATQARDQIAAATIAWRSRTVAIPTETAQAESDLTARLDRIPAMDAEARDSAEGVLVRAEIAALRAKIAMLEEERRAQEALVDLLELRGRVAERRLRAATEREAIVRELVFDARRAAAIEDEASASQVADRAAALFVELEPTAVRIKELARIRSGDDGLTHRLEQVDAATRAAEAQKAEIKRRFVAMRYRLRAGGLTEGLGRTLRRDLDWLPTERDLRDRRRERRVSRSRVQLLVLDIEEERDQLGEVDDELRALLGERTLTDEDERAVRAALLARRDLTASVQKDAKSFVTRSYELGAEMRGVEVEAERYRAAIEQRILWVRSVAAEPPRGLLRAPSDAAEFARLVAGPEARASARRAVSAASRRTGILALLGVALLALGPVLRRRLASFESRVRSYRTDRFVYTVRAIALTILLALPVPLLLLAASEVLTAADTPALRAVGGALGALARPLGAVELLRQLLVEGGVGEAHFRWPSRLLRELRSKISWYIPVMGVLATTFGTIERIDDTELVESVGRLCFVAAMVLSTWLLHSCSRALFQDDDDPSVRPPLWARLTVGLPSVLAVTSIFGYAYTASRFAERLELSIALGLTLYFVHALLQRWLYITRRKLAVEQARQRAQARAEAEADGELASDAAPALDEDAVDIPAVDAQTRQLFRSVVTLSAVVGLYLIWSGVLPALRELDRVQLLPRVAILEVEPVAVPQIESTGGSDASAASASPVPGAPIPSASSPDGAAAEPAGPYVLTLADLVLAILFGIVTFIAVRNVPGLLELTVLRRLPIDAGTRYAITTIVRYIIAIAGISAVSNAIGVGWSQIQWLAAALTFGLAFGLQEIFANFVSGLIILLERPVRVGDIVTVDGTDGRITRLRMRATTLQDWERREYLIPNKTFITSTVINWTLSDPVTRLHLPVGVAYGSDTKRAREILTSVAEATPGVLEDPEPVALFRRFGESTLDLELRVFVQRADQAAAVLDELHSSIDDAFREAGIETAFPQRDLHVRSVDPDVMRAARDGGEGRD